MSIFNNGEGGPKEGDGAELSSVPHPVSIVTTADMREAGAHVMRSMLPVAGPNADKDLQMVAHAVYTVMVEKEPYHDISDDALVETEVDVPLPEWVADLIKAEQDRCCRLVFGHASSDNAAQRTVDAIRGKIR